MDAVKCLKEMNRMCNGSNCCECPLFTKNNGKAVECEVLEERYAEEAVTIVEKWSKEHPVKTRQSEFLKVFPNASLNELGSLTICPMDADKNQRCPEKSGARCMDCRREYWLAEVER